MQGRLRDASRGIFHDFKRKPFREENPASRMTRGIKLLRLRLDRVDREAGFWRR